MPIEEIEVREQPIEVIQPVLRALRGRGLAAPPAPEPFPVPGSGPGIFAFVPPVVPKVVEEIIVTAPRPGAPVVGPTLGATFASLGIATVIGFTAREILDELGEQMLEREFAELMAPDAFRPGDTPVVVTKPETIPEIIVTAKRLDVIRDFYLPPMPQFDFPDKDLIILPRPQVQPQPQPTLPDVEIAPITAPQIQPATPPRIPRRPPSRIRTPRRTRIETQTQTEILTQTQTQVQPFTLTSPLTSPLAQALPSLSPASRARTRTRTRTRTQTLAQRLRGLVGAGSPVTTCPPCPKKDKEKPRSRCYKKLVKEAFLPSLDKEYDWVEINCYTGREL